jgi:hypothetical protein
MNKTCACWNAAIDANSASSTHRNHPRYFSTSYAFGFLAALIPALRYAFLLMIILIPWIIYVNIRRYVGRLWWFIQIASRRSTLSSDIMT